MLKKFLGFLTGLKFGIFLFLLIAVYSIIGTVLPQGLGPEIYSQNYGSFAKLIVLFQFNNVYSSLIFRTMILIFIINLLGCTLNILPGQLNRLKDTYFPNKRKESKNLYQDDLDMVAFKDLLKKKRFKISENEEGFYASKHRIGNIGSSITHLGIIVIILGAFIGNVFFEEGFINMIPGDMKAFDDYGFSLGVDDFYLEFREDGSVEQYNSKISVYEKGEKIKEDVMWVNKPFSHNKLQFFQSSFGWVSNLIVRDVEGEVFHEELLRKGQRYFYQPEHLTIYNYGFYPDFNITKSGEPFTMTEKKVNPHYAVVLYEFDKMVDSYIVEPGQAIKYKDITIEFEDSILYTGITYNRDFGYMYVLIGCTILIFGLLLSFYFYPKYICVTKESIIPITNQNAWGYEMQIKRLLSSLKKQSKDDL